MLLVLFLSFFLHSINGSATIERLKYNKEILEIYNKIMPSIISILNSIGQIAFTVIQENYSDKMDEAQFRPQEYRSIIRKSYSKNKMQLNILIISSLLSTFLILKYLSSKCSFKSCSDYVCLINKAKIENMQFKTQKEGFEIISSKIIGHDNVVKYFLKDVEKIKKNLIAHSPTSWFFVGSTGTGKTKLAYAISEYIYDCPPHIIQCSNFCNANSLNKFEEALIVDDTYGIVLFDEFDKLHQDFKLILLSILDNGSYSTVYDKEYIKINYLKKHIILTSNMGDELWQNKSASDENSEEIKLEIEELMRKNMRPEFLGRIDKIVHFPAFETHDLNLRNLNVIFDDFFKSLKKKYGINIVIDKSFEYPFFYDKKFGIRFFKKNIERKVRFLLQDLEVEDIELNDSTYKLCIKNKKIVFIEKNTDLDSVNTDLIDDI